MKRIKILLTILGIVIGSNLITTTLQAQDKRCERIIVVELKQSHFTLDPGKWIKDSMNKVRFRLPVSADFYDTVQIGDDLLQKRFRWGSLFTEGSIGSWHLKVVAKE
jgi:hypothetical protein